MNTGHFQINNITRIRALLHDIGDAKTTVGSLKDLYVSIQFWDVFSIINLRFHVLDFSSFSDGPAKNVSIF